MLSHRQNFRVCLLWQLDSLVTEGGGQQVKELVPSNLGEIGVSVYLHFHFQW